MGNERYVAKCNCGFKTKRERYFYKAYAGLISHFRKEGTLLELEHNIGWVLDGYLAPTKRHLA